MPSERDRDAAAWLADPVRLGLALSAAGTVGVWEGDLVEGLVYGDENLARIYGVDTADTGTGQPSGHYFRYMHPEDLEGARQEMDRLFAGKPDYVHEHRILRSDGTMRWVLARGRLVRDANGRAVRFSGVSLDITERRQAEARQAFLLDLSDALRGLDDPTAILDTALARLGRHLGVSRAGYSEIDTDRQTIAVLCCYADGVPALNAHFPFGTFGAGNAARSLAGLVVARDDVLADPLNAAPIWKTMGTRGLISIPLIREERLRATVWVTTMTPRAWQESEVSLVGEVAARVWDALQRARAERELRAANAELEQRIAAALREQSRIEDALRQAQKMEAIGQLTGGIAHDFNNMLQGISSGVELMRRRIADGRPEEAARYVDAARKSIERAAALTHRLLAFSRRQALAPCRVDLADLVHGMESLLRQTAGPAITMQLDLASPCWPVLCDPNQLENALLNLAINARDAMLPDGGTLSLASGHAVLTTDEAGEAAPGEYVRISVRDTGSGMSPDVLEHAFEPFFTTKPTGSGTGLGLSQVYGFVNQSNGMVKLQSTPGQGTTVHIYLPRHAAAADMPVTASRSGPASGAIQSATVLLVEDEADIRGFVTEALRERGCRVIAEPDGPAGLNALRALLAGEGVDMLVADVGLPGGLNGRQLADAARALSPDLPVLLITGYPGPATDAAAPLPPGMQFLAKPFELQSLVDRLDLCLNRVPEGPRTIDTPAP